MKLGTEKAQKPPLVCLAGAGRHFDAATDWRVQASYDLQQRGIATRASGKFHDAKRDFADVKRCDALLVNLLGLKELSPDTIRQLAWAHTLQRPAVVAIEKSGNPHDLHPMAGLTFEQLEQRGNSDRLGE